MGDIRIVSGKYKGRVIKAPEGQGTRPLLSRLRKSLSDILRPDLHELRLLELFGGSGAISFELLSNGAGQAVIIEMDRAASEAIELNAKALGVSVRSLRGDCLRVMERLADGGELFDLVIVAPPYFKELHLAAMEKLTKLSLVAPAGRIIVQREKKESFWEPRSPFVHERTRSYGRTVFDFYELESDG